MRIGIVGKNSYIARSFHGFLCKKNIENDLISSRDNEWNDIDFSNFDALVCAVGIAHVSANSKMADLYYAVNSRLPVDIAVKAKKSGVGQFVFLSSMIVYGNDFAIGKPYTINQNTIPNPENFYGISKLQAESELQKLSDDSFYVSLLRLPMVYGLGCKGNFQKLLFIAKRAPFFPSLKNERSMIYIENLCNYMLFIIENRRTGILFPQNEKYVSTSEIISVAASCYNNRITFLNVFNPFIRFASRRMSTLRKIWGTKIYDRSLSPDMELYDTVSFEESIRRSVEI